MRSTTKQNSRDYGASESTALLTPSVELDDLGEPAKLIPRHRLRIRKLLLVVLVITLLTPIYHIARFLHSANPRPPLVPWRYYSRQHVYGLTSATPSINEFINPDFFPAGVAGCVRLLTGKTSQSDHLLVYVQIYSTEPSTVEYITPLASADDVSVTSVRSKPMNHNPAHRTFVDVYIYTHPSANLSHLSISTNTLPIEIPASVRLTTEKLSLSSNHHISNEGGEDLRAGHISLSSAFGVINGSWAFDTTFVANAGGNNALLKLQPRTHRPGNISISAKYHISATIPFETSQKKDTTISILSERGNINAHLLASTFTNITAAAGDIIGRLLPTGMSTVETYSKFNTSLVIERPGAFKARHVAYDGWIDVEYPDEWTGGIKVESLHRRAEILGIDGAEVGGVVREREGKVYLNGQGEGRVEVFGGEDAVFRFRG
ncbi:hypothetical protein TWF481_005923 [Arthrobotrys musiformis]|uniref:Adhesin domain-containing protein n=1 Tax=Arthrobotrys musiformis TaxID=47236 RepID=A0AAV9WF87_9PEZI